MGERAISPVVDVVLMVAITLELASGADERFYFETR